MKAEVHNREIYYVFTNEEVAFLKTLGIWAEIHEKLRDHEVITVEGYERIEIE